MAKKEQNSKYETPPRIKVGRCWYVKGYDGKPIVGLSWDSGNGYFFPTHYKDTEEFQKTGKRQNFTKDYDNAIMLFRQWNEKDAFTKIKVADGDMQVESNSIRKRSDKEIAMMEELAEKLSDSERKDLGIENGISETSTCGVVGLSENDYSYGSTKIIHTLDITEAHIIAKTKELFAKYHPSVIAEKFGMPSLSKIDYTDDLKEPHTLKEIEDCYFNKVELSDPTQEQKREIDKVKMVWKLFCKSVSARTAKELKKEEIQVFYNETFKEHKRRKLSSTWMKGRFERIKRVFNAAIEKLDEVDDIITAKRKIDAVFKAPKSEIKEKPYRIPKEHFHTILEKSTVEERCMWLISMNLGGYSVDVATLPLSAIDFKDKTVVFRRSKTGNHRSGVLWNITIDAIKQFQKEFPHNGDTLFWNRQDNKPYAENRIRKRFVAVVEIAELRHAGRERLCHRNFRDSFKSICVEKGIRQASVNAVMGHRAKHDEYVDPEVFPKISEDACKAVYEYYFKD